jgi:PAT family beta-lactamase induction signal transducer AmpG
VAKFLDAFRSKRVWLLIALGFASGLPLLLSGQTLSAWMTSRGVNIKTIGLYSLVSLPYSFKFVWAPLLDRYRLPFLGRRRGWILVFQVAIAVAIFAMSGVDPVSAPGMMALLAVLLAFSSASQDIVSDAYRADVLPSNERASGTATFILGYRIALLVTGAAAFVLADHLAWPQIYRMVAVLMLVSGVTATLLAPEVDLAQPPRTLAKAVVEPFTEFFSRRGAWIALLFMMLYKFGDYSADLMTIPFLLKTGYSNTEIGTLRKVAGFIGMSTGVLLGGGLVARLGVRRALLTFGVLQAATNSGYLALAIVGKNYPLFVAGVAIDYFCSGLGAAAIGAFTLALCHKSYSATQLALFTASTTVFGRLLGSGAGYVVHAWGWPIFFALTMVVAIPALVLLSFVPRSAYPAEEEPPVAPPQPAESTA